MQSTNIEPGSAAGTSPSWLIAGHESANPAKVALKFSGTITASVLSDSDNDFEAMLSAVDAVALLINAKTGVSKSMIDFWQYLSERQFPRLVIVNGLELSESDFDDMVLIANRVLEQVSTPYLVLHDEVGEPSGLISLSDLTVHDYSHSEMKSYPADEELKSLVADFKVEFDEQFEEFGATGLSEGLFVPALPLGTSRNFGVKEIQGYLNSVTKH